jgi:phage baseplate assembly protein gpV
MMAGMLNQMRMAAAEAMADRAVTRIGTVSGYDPSTYAVKVTLQPDGTLTDWLPLASVAVGSGWGVYFAPAIGVACKVLFQEDDPGVGVVSGFFFNDEETPLSVPSGEFWIVHQSGASVKLTNDGTIAIDSGAGASVKLKGSQITSVGTWNHTGTITATGEGTFNGGHTVSAHVHSGVQAGASNTGAATG